LDRRLDVPESQFRRRGIEKISLPGIKPPVVQPVVILIEQSRLIIIIIIIINDIAKPKELSFYLIKYDLFLSARM
jgi:hypothetical protein